jgi:hypothetical protein
MTDITETPLVAAPLEPPSYRQIAKTIRLFSRLAFKAAGGESSAYEPEKDIRDLYHRMLEPKIGDLVFEMTTISGAEDDDHINAVGYLLFDGEGTHPAGHQAHLYKIRTLDGREHTWGNARFLAVPEGLG